MTIEQATSLLQGLKLSKGSHVITFTNPGVIEETTQEGEVIIHTYTMKEDNDGIVINSRTFPACRIDAILTFVETADEFRL